MPAKFEDFTLDELRRMVRDYNLHLIIKKYAHSTKPALVKQISAHMYIDSRNEIKIWDDVLRKFSHHFKDIKPGFIRKKLNELNPK